MNIFSDYQESIKKIQELMQWSDENFCSILSTNIYHWNEMKKNAALFTKQHLILLYIEACGQWYDKLDMMDGIADDNVSAKDMLDRLMKSFDEVFWNYYFSEPRSSFQKFVSEEETKDNVLEFMGDAVHFLERSLETLFDVKELTIYHLTRRLQSDEKVVRT